MKIERSLAWTKEPVPERAVYDKLYVMPHQLRLEWRDAVDRLRTAQGLFAQARKYPLHYGIVGVTAARRGVLHALDDLWGVQGRVDLIQEEQP